MADKITEGNSLAIGLTYDYTNPDDQVIKTRNTYIKVPNPRSGLTEQQIRTVAAQLIAEDGGIIRNAEGGTYDSSTAIFTAYTEYEKKIEYDLGLD